MGDQKDRAGPEASLAGEDSSPTSRWKVGVCIAPAYQISGAWILQSDTCVKYPQGDCNQGPGCQP